MIDIPDEEREYPYVDEHEYNCKYVMKIKESIE